jgi:hypothetical protein
MKAEEAKKLKELKKRKLQIKKDGGGLDAGQSHADGYRPGKLLSPARRRDAVERLEEQFYVSERLACVTVGQARSTQRLSSPEKSLEKRILQRIDELVRENPRSGYRSITAMLRLEGWAVNVKRIHRLWKREGYRVPPRRKKRLVHGQAANACNKKIALFRNDVWTYDFIFDRFADGRALKILAVTDEYTRQSLALEADISMNGNDVVSILSKIAAEHGFPAYIRSEMVRSS